MYMPCRSKGAHPSDLIYDTVLGDVDIHQQQQRGWWSARLEEEYSSREVQ